MGLGDAELAVPDGVHLNIAAGTGDVSLEGLSTDFDIKMGKGDAELEPVNFRGISIKNGYGNIALRLPGTPDEFSCYIELNLDTRSSFELPESAHIESDKIVDGRRKISALIGEKSNERSVKISLGYGNIVIEQ